MAISLGRNCVLTWDSVTVPGVRDVVVSSATQTLDFQPFGSRASYKYPTAYSASLTVVTIDSAAATTAEAALEAGTEIAVSADGWTFTAIVTAVSDSQPLDDVRAWSIALEKTYPGLR